MWPNAPSVRLEHHYGERVVLCYASRPRSVDEMLRQAASRRPTSIAYVDGERRQTYAGLNASADSIAAALIARGVEPGDRVALILDNRGEFAEAFFGILRAGAIAVALNIRDQRPELEYLLGHAQAKLVIHESDLADRLPGPDTVPHLCHRVCVGSSVKGSDHFSTLTGSHSPPPRCVQEDATAAILYTSGTTGRPKGAMLTNLSIVASVMNYELCWQLTDEDKAVMAVPVSHVTGLVAILLTMVRVGGTTIFMRSFKAARFLALAAAEQMSYTLIVPAMYNLCLLQSDFDSHNLSNWRVGGYGGAPMPPATIARVAEKLPGLRLVNAYGATETTSPATLMPVGEGVARADTVGKPVPTSEVVIMGNDGNELPAGSSGDVWIRGANVIAGYWRDEMATRAAFCAGFWNSGDVGCKSSDGYLRLLDRKKDLINRGGYKVYSAEVEAILMQHPDVAEAAVIAVPDDVLGEKSHAVIRGKTASCSAQEIEAFCAAHLSDYKVPDFITVIDYPLPRNSAGKVLKRDLNSLSAALPDRASKRR